MCSLFMVFLTGIPLSFSLRTKKGYINWTFSFCQGGQAGHSRTKGEGRLTAFQPSFTSKEISKAPACVPCHKVIQRVGCSGMKQDNGIATYLKKGLFLWRSVGTFEN